MATLDGKVALVTGAGRGQGRCHAVRLAEEGASVIAIDVAGPVAEHNGYPATTPEDLEQTRTMLAATAGRHHVATADVRDSAALDAVLAEAIPKLGARLDIVVAWGVNTAMLDDPTTAAMFESHPHYLASFAGALPSVPAAEPNDIADAVIWLASDRSRAVTGTQLTVDMGATKI